MVVRRVLVEEAAAPPGAAVAVQLAVGVLDGELVVVGELLAPVDLPQGEDDDVLVAVHADDPRVAVGLARVVDEASRVAVHGSVHHLKVVDAEHVAADTLGDAERTAVFICLLCPVIFCLFEHFN